MSLFHADAARFEQLAAPCEKQVYFVCLGMMGNEQDAQDCAQEAMLRAFRAFSRFRREATFATWLHRIAVNACLDALRKRKESLSLDALSDIGFEPTADTPAPYARMEEADRKKALRAALLQLPAELRAALILRDVQDMPYEEVAKALKLPLGTVKSRINRARTKLREILSQNRELFEKASV